MDPEKRERLRKNHVLLKENLQVPPLLDRMYEKDVLTYDEHEEIRCKVTTPEKCQAFLDILRRKGNTGYNAFCEVLKDVQPNILKKIEETHIDRDTLGEESASNIFYDPSDDFELKGLIDELTKEDHITTEQLERMKNLVTGEIGCVEEIVEKLQTPAKFLRHLMKSRLLTRYNLSFLQSLLWRVGNKMLCQEVAKFSRQISQNPIHFYTPPNKTENGYTFGKFHIKGNCQHFKGITIEEICLRVSRYLGVPHTDVIPVGVQPSESLVLTIRMQVVVMETLKSVDTWSWLTGLGVDHICHDDGKIILEESTSLGTDSEQQVLERELKRKIEVEQHLKQCLYDEQISNENLKDLQAQLEEQLEAKEDTVKELNAWYLRIFTVLLISLHFIAELLKERRGGRVPGGNNMLQQMSYSQFLDAIQRAKKFSSNHDSLMQLVDATQQIEKIRYISDIDVLQESVSLSLTSMQQNLNEAVTMRMVERSFGVYQRKPSLNEVRQASIAFSIIVGISRLEPLTEQILADLLTKLEDEQLQRICVKFDVPQGLQTPELRSKIFCYVIFSEMDKQGKREATAEDLGQIVKACFREAGRKDLWKIYEHTFQKHIRKQREEREAQTRKDLDINDRLDKMEKMLRTIVGQGLMGSMGMPGFGGSGTSPNSTGISKLLSTFVKETRPHFPNFHQHGPDQDMTQ